MPQIVENARVSEDLPFVDPNRMIATRRADELGLIAGNLRNDIRRGQVAAVQANQKAQGLAASHQANEYRRGLMDRKDRRGTAHSVAPLMGGVGGALAAMKEGQGLSEAFYETEQGYLDRVAKRSQHQRDEDMELVRGLANQGARMSGEDFNFWQSYSQQVMLERENEYRSEKYRDILVDSRSRGLFNTYNVDLSGNVQDLGVDEQTEFYLDRAAMALDEGDFAQYRQIIDTAIDASTASRGKAVSLGNAVRGLDQVQQSVAGTMFGQAMVPFIHGMKEMVMFGVVDPADVGTTLNDIFAGALDDQRYAQTRGSQSSGPQLTWKDAYDHLLEQNYGQEPSIEEVKAQIDKWNQIDAATSGGAGTRVDKARQTQKVRFPQREPGSKPLAGDLEPGAVEEPVDPDMAERQSPFSMEDVEPIATGAHSVVTPALQKFVEAHGDAPTKEDWAELLKELHIPLDAPGSEVYSAIRMAWEKMVKDRAAKESNKALSQSEFAPQPSPLKGQSNLDALRK